MHFTAVLLRLCGVKIDDAGHLAGARLVLRNSDLAGWIIIAGLVILVLTLVELPAHRAGTYFTADALGAHDPPRAPVLLLLLILLRPVLAFTVEGTIRRQPPHAGGHEREHEDPGPALRRGRSRPGRDGERPARFPQGPAQQPLDQTHAASVKLVPRVDLLQGVLKSDELALIQKFSKEYDVSAFGFGQTLAEIGGDNAWIDQLDPKSQSTAIGDAVREVLERKRGQPLAGIFLANRWGENNTGTQPVEAARLARAEGVPLYIYGVGITSPRDIIVANLFTQEVAFAKDELPVTVRVRGQGLRGEKAKITLKLGDEIVASKDLTFGGDEEQTVALPFTPKQIGEYELRASIDPREDEAAKDNNAVSQRLKVIDSKIKVLMVDESPRWEFRYLQSVLLRDRRIELKCWLVEGDPALAEGVGSPYVKTFPPTKERPVPV